jgi:hypothetical protein
LACGGRACAPPPGWRAGWAILANEKDADRQRVERAGESLGLQAFHVDEVGDGQRAAEMRRQQPQELVLALADDADPLLAAQPQLGHAVGVAYQVQPDRIDQPLRPGPFLVVAAGAQRSPADIAPGAEGMIDRTRVEIRHLEVQPDEIGGILGDTRRPGGFDDG